MQSDTVPMEQREFHLNSFLISIHKPNRGHGEVMLLIDVKTHQIPDIKSEQLQHNEHWLCIMQEENLEVMVT